MIVSSIGVNVIPWESSAVSGQPVLRELRQSAFALIDFGAANAAKELLASSAIIGEPLWHKHSGGGEGSDPVVSIVAGNDMVRRPQNTPDIQSPHADGCFLADPPVLVALHCLEKAALGGESLFLRGEDLVLALLDRFTPDRLLPLFEHDAYTIRRGDTLLARPVLELCSHDRIAVLFSDHEFNTATPSPAVAEPFQLAREFVRDPQNLIALPLRAGQCALFVNSAVLHGRKAWVDGPSGRRQVQRIWFDGSPLRAAGIVPGIRPTGPIRELADLGARVRKGPARV